ncbi:MAG: ACT domain-containing protein [Ruminococcus sp.]|nr:ACT domain-containing protein [Ruminococcus sp.]
MAEKDGGLVIVSSDVLPDIISKVLSAKQLKARGEVSTSAEACRTVGISRSAYYKYKDSVFKYEEQFANNIVSVYCVLRDEKGVLSSIITKLYELNTNILTINQNIPIDSVATVTISLRFDHEINTTATLKKELMALDGVVDVKIISGE